MLEIYNGVLPSGSVSKLALLTLLMLALYALSGALDVLRLALLGRTALRIDQSLSARVFAIVQLTALKGRASGDGLQPVRDLDQIRAFLSGPGPTALFDMPWMPLYLGVIYLMHPLLGLLATLGAVGLVGLMLLAETGSAAPVRAAAQCASQRWAFASAARRNAEAIRAMGFKEHLGRRWCALNDCHLDAQLRAMGQANVIGAMIKVARPALQSGILGLGAYLVIHDDGSPGTMIAASIVLSRALAPVETAIAYWRGFVAARQAHARLVALLAANPDEVARRPAPKPHRSLRVEGLAIAPPGVSAPVLREVGFTLQAGAGLGIVGPSASGKTTLARALVGAWQPQAGSVRLDGRPIAQWGADALGRHIGYLPQDIGLFEGTIADNIARFDASATEAAITAAARAAGVHEMIAALPGGYATDIGDGGLVLSGGQRQRLGLARALYGEPFLVVLDEPNANLDADGEGDLTQAIASVRRRGGIVIVIAHRRSALQGVDTVLALVAGRVRAIGPKEAVLALVDGQVRAFGPMRKSALGPEVTWQQNGPKGNRP
jgi:ATP-binding cassette subfamily C protein